MANIVYPVYRFVGYMERDYIYYASSTRRADEFVSAYNRLHLGRNNGAYLATSRPLPEGKRENTYRGWTIDWEYGYFTAVHDNYDAEYVGPEDGWVDNGLRASARTLADLLMEIDEHDETKRTEAAHA